MLDDVTCLDHWPTLDYWESRPGRSALIVDDISWSLSKRGSPSQHELADRTCGHISSHHSGGLSIFIAQQTHTGITPKFALDGSLPSVAAIVAFAGAEVDAAAPAGDAASLQLKVDELSEALASQESRLRERIVFMY